MNVHWLDSPACRDPSRFGGKAAHLARLAENYPVPPAFCLAAARRSAPRLTAGQRAELTAAYAELTARCGPGDPPVAVRSSAVDEDGRDASFAGQHETYLNIRGTQAMLAAVERCLASAQLERAQAYRRAHGLPAAASVAVLVQQLVCADVSAVIFSVDPSTSAPDRVVVNATWGLGESLVGGSVTPDLYVVRKADFTIVSSQISAKLAMTVAAAVGTREVPVPRCMQSDPALRDHQVVSLAQLACALEGACGWPVDVECAYARDQLYLLQCRPVTAVSGPGQT